MKKRLIIFILVVFMFIGLFNLESTTSKAALSFDDFHDFAYTISPKFKNGEIIWEVNVRWYTTEEIKYLHVLTTLENGHVENTYETGRRNIAELLIDEVTNNDETTYWVYQLDFSINTEDLQRIKIEFIYSYVDAINPSKAVSKTIFLSTGNTIVKSEISDWYAVLAGLIISLCAGCATFVIIQNTKNSLIKTTLNEEDELQDE